MPLGNNPSPELSEALSPNAQDDGALRSDASPTVLFDVVSQSALVFPLIQLVCPRYEDLQRPVEASVLFNVMTEQGRLKVGP